MSSKIGPRGPRRLQEASKRPPKCPQECKPTCTTCVLLPGAPQPFWFKGPLEPPLGGHFHILGTLQRAYTNILIYQSKSTPTLESHSFLERALRHVGWTWPARTSTWAGSCQTWSKREKIIITDLHAITKTLRTRLHDRGCHYY